MELEKELIYKYKRNGVIVIRNFWTKDEVNLIVDNLDDIKEKYKNFKDRTVNFSKNGEINSIHGVYEHPIIKQLGSKKKVFELAEILLENKENKIRASEFFLKPKSVGLSVPCHQDNGYWCLKNGEGFTLWTALTKCDNKSGSVWYYHGSHHLGDIQHINSFRPGSSQELSEENKLLVEKVCGTRVSYKMNPGDILVHHSRTVHGSEPNLSDNHRIGWTLQLISNNDSVNQERKNRYLNGLKKQLVNRKQEKNDGVLYTKFQA